MYKADSKIAEEFIDHQEILETLEYARSNKSNRALIEQRPPVPFQLLCERMCLLSLSFEEQDHSTQETDTRRNS